MSKCKNCGATMSCGCQKRTLPDGKPACSKCITNPTQQTGVAIPAPIRKVRNSQYNSPVPIVNSAEIINTDK